MSNQAKQNAPERLGVVVNRVMERFERPTMPDNAPKAHPMLGKPDETHVYTDDDDEPSLIVYRFDKSDNSDKRPRKEFRPFDLAKRQWRAPIVRPLYRLDLLKAAEDSPVVLVEGEKCADTLNDIGILATATFGGSNGLGKADLSPLKGRHVVIWPDLDEPGLKYAVRVSDALRETEAEAVRIVRTDALRDLPQGWDAADALRDGWRVDDLLALINSAEGLKASDALTGLAPLKGAGPLRDISLKDIGSFKENGSFKEPANDPHWDETEKFFKESSFKEPCLKEPSLKEPSLKEPGPIDLGLKEREWGEPDMSVLNPRPKPPEFPTYLFGAFWSKWLARQAEGKSAPVDYVGGTLLASASSTIGNARRVSPWPSWEEPAHLWVALVGGPSSGKSPGMEPIISIIRIIEAEEAEGHGETLKEYEADVIAAKHLRDQWEKDVKTAAQEGYPPPIKPDGAIEPLKPQRPRIRVSDATPESLMSLLSQLSKGVLMTRDELAGWFGSFNRYAGGDGGDRAFWLEAWGGREYTVDRVKNGQAITIPHLSIGVLGGIQPDKVESTLLKGDDDGLRTRFLYLWPDPVPVARPQAAPEGPEALNAFKALHGLEMGSDEHGNPIPVTVMLTDEAATFFETWWKGHTSKQPEGALAGWWGKMPGVCLRLALTFEGLWNAADGKPLDHVCKQAVEAATVMIDDYLKPMAVRTFGDAARSEEERNAAILATWILKNRPERINPRDIIRGAGTPNLGKAIEVHQAIDELVRVGWLNLDASRAGYTKGRRRMDYMINPNLFDCAECCDFETWL